MLGRDSGIAMNDVMDMPLSFDYSFYKSEAWTIAKKILKQKSDEKLALFKALNEVIKSNNVKR